MKSQDISQRRCVRVQYTYLDITKSVYDQISKLHFQFLYSILRSSTGFKLLKYVSNRCALVQRRCDTCVVGNLEPCLYQRFTVHPRPDIETLFSLVGQPETQDSFSLYIYIKLNYLLSQLANFCIFRHA